MSTDGKLYEAFSEAIQKIVDAYKVAKSDDKLSFTDIISLVGTAIGEMVSVAEVFHGGDGSAKKAAVLAAVGTFYDEVIAPMDIAKIPNFIEPIVDKGVKQLILVIADGTIDAIVAIFNKGGWPDNTPDTPDDPQS